MSILNIPLYLEVIQKGNTQTSFESIWDGKALKVYEKKD
jgi:hypothetical protein